MPEKKSRRLYSSHLITSRYLESAVCAKETDSSIYAKCAGLPIKDVVGGYSRVFLEPIMFGDSRYLTSSRIFRPIRKNWNSRVYWMLIMALVFLFNSGC